MGKRGQASDLTGCFRYTKLQHEREFRIFELLPRRKDGEIHGILHHAHLDEAGAYTAISYRWGPPNPRTDKRIWVNDKPFVVRRNAWQLLKDLRKVRAVSSAESLILWIDAICINQSDEDERGSQVRLMRHIYRSSLEVAAYLGPSQWYLATICRHNKLNFERHRGRWGGMSMAGRLAIIELSKRAYWTRVWICGELILAPSIVLLVGKRQVLWSSFGKTIQKLREQLPDMPACRIIDWYSEYGDVQDRMGIVEVLHNFKDQQCEDPRDGLYGLLSFIKGAEGFPIDYKAPITAIFHTAWAYFSGSYGPSRWLRLAHLLRQCLKLDSKTYCAEARNLTSADLTGRAIRDVEPYDQFDAQHDADEERICTLEDVILGRPTSSSLLLPAPVSEVQICRCAICATQLDFMSTSDLMDLANRQKLVVRRIYAFHESFLLYKHSSGEEYKPFACIDPIVVPAPRFHLQPQIRLIVYAIPPGLEATPIEITLAETYEDGIYFEETRGDEILIQPRLLYKVLFDMRHPQRASFQDEELPTKSASTVAPITDDILNIPGYLHSSAAASRARDRRTSTTRKRWRTAFKNSLPRRSWGIHLGFKNASNYDSDYDEPPAWMNRLPRITGMGMSMSDFFDV